MGHVILTFFYLFLFVQILKWIGKRRDAKKQSNPTFNPKPPINVAEDEEVLESPSIDNLSDDEEIEREVTPYFAKNVLTKTELILMERLTNCYPEYYVLAQVQLSQMLGVHKGNNYMSWFNRINRMSIDFVICDANAEVLVAIELDDWTHNRPDRVEADAKKDRTLEDAGIRLVRMRAERIPSEEKILEILNLD